MTLRTYKMKNQLDNEEDKKEIKELLIKIENKLKRLIDNSPKYSLSCLEIMKPFILQTANPSHFIKMACDLGDSLAKTREKTGNEIEDLEKRSGNISNEGSKILELSRINRSNFKKMSIDLEIVNNTILELFLNLHVSNKNIHSFYLSFLLGGLLGSKRRRDQKFL